MKCVHCGANIPDGQLICPRCNAEVQMVPDYNPCLLYTSDAADEEDSVDLGGRRRLKKKKRET